MLAHSSRSITATSENFDKKSSGLGQIQPFSFSDLTRVGIDVKNVNHEVFTCFDIGLLEFNRERSTANQLR